MLIYDYSQCIWTIEQTVFPPHIKRLNMYGMVFIIWVMDVQAYLLVWVIS